MHPSIRFINSAKLSRSDLACLLTPEECVQQFSRFRNPTDVVKSLPRELAQRVSLTAKKSTAGLLSALQKELVQANWIALTNTPNHHSLDDARFRNAPRLKSRIETLADIKESRTPKASYKPVTDDVTLVRNYAHVPYEPSPEHKIVVEFAGQWSSHAACLMLLKSEDQAPKVTNARSDMENQHRSLATFAGLSEEARDLCIKVPCTDQPQPITLPLATALTPVEKDAAMEEWDNVLIPVLPMLESGRGSELCSSGYFYVIWNNKVWREVEVAPNGYFADVDLEYYRNAEPEGGKAFRHVNIDGANLVNEYYVGEEPFELYQAGNKVYSGTLNVDQSARVFRLTEEEVEVAFPTLDIEPITVKTVKSPSKAGDGDDRVAQGTPLPHIWVPYKINGEIQSECYLHYSPLQLTLAELSNLESDPSSIAKPLAELKVYSDSQSFDNTGTVIIPVGTAKESAFGAALINSFTQSNIAGFKMAPCGDLPTIRYLHEPLVDQPDDFFALRNVEHDWIAKSFFRSTKIDDEGYMTHRFAFPPEEVETVDIVRAVHANSSTGLQRLVVLEENVPISEFLG
ncbi:hypothetical protein [Vibrio campbellii]|uniref:hypothetical protein n=2 Tax=Vibrio campbellii TaxID=680 RepID=UPI00210D30A1|nr:hypothetical protein [Vibrio campbellii]